MREIINGKKYDTEKAELVAVAREGLTIMRALYRTKEGEWFVCRFDKPKDGDTGSGWISLASEEEVRGVLHQELCERYFGTGEEAQ